MKLTIEVYVSIFLLCIASVLCVGFISADIQVANAREAYYSYESIMQDGNLADSVIQACQEDAANNGYVLSVSVINNEDGTRSANTALSFKYTIAFLNISNTKYIRGYISGSAGSVVGSAETSS